MVRITSCRFHRADCMCELHCADCIMQIACADCIVQTASCGLHRFLLSSCHMQLFNEEVELSMGKGLCHSISNYI